MGQVVVGCEKCTFDDDGNRDTNYGGDVGVKCQNGVVKEGNYVSYYEVDLSAQGIPADAIVQLSSKFEQYVFSLFEGEAETHTYRMTALFDAWDEDTLTYNNRPNVDFPIVAGIAGPGGINTWYSITGSDLVDFIQDALDNRSGIFSVRLEALEVEDGFIARSDDSEEEPPNIPKLTVVWLVPHVQTSVLG